MQAYEKSDLMSKRQRTDADVLHASLFGTPYESIGHLRRQLEYDDQNPLVYNDLGAMYIRLLQYDQAIPEYKKALEIYNKWGTKPFWVFNYIGLGIAYHNTGQYRKEEKIYKLAERDFPGNPELMYRQAILSLAEGDTGTENRYIDKYITARKGQSWSEAGIAESLAAMYSEAGILDEAEKYYRQALSLEPENPSRMNNLARFLIDKDKNLNEGLELVDKALEINPDNYLYLDTKGLGLYKLGKFEEALTLLQKSDSFKPVYNHKLFLHLEDAKKAVAGQGKN
jgi:tetratricopeptide (TPR) repeat protein